VDSQTLVKYGPSIVEAAGGMASAVGSYAEGQQARKAAKFEAQQLEAQGTAAYAKGTREAALERRKAAILTSNTRAAQAGSGAAFDEGAVETLGDIGAEGEYNALSALFEGESQQAGLKAQAAARRWEGKQQQSTAMRKTLSTIISGASKGFKAYQGYRDDKSGLTESKRIAAGPEYIDRWQHHARRKA